VKNLSPWRTNNPKALFIIIFSFKTKYQTFQLELFSNPYWKLIEFLTPCRNDIFYYYIDKPCTCGFTTSLFPFQIWRNADRARSDWNPECSQQLFPPRLMFVRRGKPSSRVCLPAGSLFEQPRCHRARWWLCCCPHGTSISSGQLGMRPQVVPVMSSRWCSYKVRSSRCNNPIFH